MCCYCFLEHTFHNFFHSERITGAPLCMSCRSKHCMPGAERKCQPGFYHNKDSSFSSLITLVSISLWFSYFYYLQL